MIKLLSKFFIKETDSIDNPEIRTKYGMMCSLLGIFLNIIMFMFKLLAGFISGSIAIMADAVNNITDAGSSVVTLVGFRLADQKPDSEHPFGHGRIEYVSGLIVAFIIILMGFELAKSSVSKIVSPEPIEAQMLTFIILLCAVFVKLYMYFYNKRIGTKINSSAMKATASDSLNDAIATFVVMLSMMVFKLTGYNIDAWVGLLVSLFILYSGIKTVKETIDPLLGQPPEKEFIDKIKRIAMSYPETIGIHDLIVHDYGPGRVILSLHVEIDGKSNIYKIHEAIDRLENEIEETLSCIATIHIDPVETNNETINRLKDEVADLVKKIDEKTSIHDFRVVPGEERINVIFDVVVPFEIDLTDNEIKDKVNSLIKTLDKRYCAVVKIDRLSN